MFTKGHVRFLAAVVAVLCGVIPWAALAFENSAVPGPSRSGGGGGLLTTGGTMTGQQVFSGVATDISTGTNEPLTLAPNGTGNVLVPDSDIIVSGAASQLIEVDVDSGSATVATHSDAATGSASFWSWNSAKSLVVSNIGYFGASYSETDYADKTLWYSLGKTIEINQYNDIAAGTAVVRFTDNAAGTAALLMSIDGAGRVAPLLYGSQSNCADSAGDAACSAAPVGRVVVDAADTTTVVSTTAVTASSEILVRNCPYLGAALSVTCNTAELVHPEVTAISAGTSFTITTYAYATGSATAPATNPLCVCYSIIN